MRTKAITKNLKTTLELAKELDIPLILDCGSLLGAYRDKDVIPGDEDDLDFAVPSEVAEHKMRTVIFRFMSEGFTLLRLRPTVISLERGGSHVDFLFYKEMNDMYYLTLYHNKKPIALTAHKEAYDDLGTIEFLGEEVPCPKDIEKHLEHRYGKDWRTPIFRPAFSFQNYLDIGSAIWLE